MTEQDCGQLMPGGVSGMEMRSNSVVEINVPTDPTYQSNSAET